MLCARLSPALLGLALLTACDDAPAPAPEADVAPAPVEPQDPKSKTAYEILEISSQATWPEIKQAYQDRIRQYHPDRLADMAPELQEIAQQRSAEINAAYEKLKAQKA